MEVYLSDLSIYAQSFVRISVFPRSGDYLLSAGSDPWMHSVRVHPANRRSV